MKLKILSITPIMEVRYVRRRPEQVEDDITDEERAIIASMIEEEERLKEMGIPPGSVIDYSGVLSSTRDVRTDEVTDRNVGPSYEELSNKQYVIDITDAEDPRPLALRLQSLSREREADQWQLKQIESRQTIPGMVPLGAPTIEVLDFLQHDNNIEETEEFRETGESARAVPSAASLSKPFVLMRQPSYYTNPADVSQPINPLLLLGSNPSAYATAMKAAPVRQRQPPNISRCSYGFTYNIQYENLKVPTATPFCFQWVGDILRLSGTICLDYSQMSGENLLEPCKVWILSAVALFHAVNPLDAALEESMPETGNIFFYLIDPRFLGRPLIAKTIRGIKGNSFFESFVYTINYDESKTDYYILFYSTLSQVPHQPKAYHDLVNSKSPGMLIEIDTTVHLVLDADRDL